MATLNDPKEEKKTHQTEALEEIISRLKSSLATLGKKYADECVENDKLREEITKLQEVLDRERKPTHESQGEQVQQLEKQLSEAESKIHDLESWGQGLDSKNKTLSKDLKELKEDYRKQLEMVEEMSKGGVNQLEREGKLCDKNCVRLALHWIVCEKILETICCSEQLGSIIIGYGIGKRKLAEPDMRCDYFMDVLLSCGIVQPLDANGIKEAWIKLEKGLYFLATKIPSLTTGHVVVCDVQDGKITFHDPAAPSPNERSREMTQKDFTDYVKESEKIGLFTVNITELGTIVNHHKKLGVLHIPCETHSKFGNTPEEE